MFIKYDVSAFSIWETDTDRMYPQTLEVARL